MSVENAEKSLKPGDRVTVICCEDEPRYGLVEEFQGGGQMGADVERVLVVSYGYGSVRLYFRVLRWWEDFGI